MGEVAGVAARFLCLRFVMRNQRVQFLDQRRDLDGEGAGNPIGAPAAHPRDLQPKLAQRQQAIESLQRRQHHEAKPQ